MDETVATNALDTVVAALDGVFDIATSCFNYALENPLLTFFIAVGMIPVGVYVFQCIKGLSKH